MYDTHYSGLRKWVIKTLHPRSPGARLAIILGATILYSIGFYLFGEQTSSLGMLLIAIPVALTGWYFGILAGLAAGLAASIFNLILFLTTPGYGLQTWLEAKFVPNALMFLTVGFLMGFLRRESNQRYTVRKELRARERYFAIINNITQNILEIKDAEERHYRLITLLTNLFSADYAYLFRWDALQEQATLLATTLNLDADVHDLVIEPSDAAIVASTLKTGNALIIEDVTRSEYTINPGPFKQLSLPTRSALCIPLIIKEVNFGTALIAYNTPRHFTPEEIQRAEEAGRQIALGLWTIQQEAEIQKQLKEAQALARIEQSLSKTQLVGLTQVLQLIVDSARELIPGTEQAIIHLLSEENQILIPRAISGRRAPDRPNQLNMRLGEGVAGQVIAQGEVVNIPDVETDVRFLRQTAPVRFHSLMVAPVQSGVERLGTISIQSAERNVFNAGHGALLTSLGTQAAIAIENVRLLEATQQGLKEVNALYRITQGLAASLETEQLMQDVVELLQENLGFYHAQIYTIDPQSAELVLTQASGKIGEQLKRTNQRMPAGAGIVGHAVETGEPFVTNSVEDVIFFVRNPLLPDTQAELAVPIKMNNQVLGVLDVQQTPPRHLTKRDLQLVSTVADQLAIALQKASLYSDLQISLIQEKKVRSQLVQSERLALVGRLLASVSHELNNPLQAIQNALFLLKDEHGLSVQGRQDLQIVLSEAERMAAMIDRLRTSYRPTQKEDFQAIQLNTIVEDIHTLVATHLRHNQIAFEFHPDPDLPVISASPDQIRQVVLNLLMNAAEAMPGGGLLSVFTEHTKENEVRVSFQDTGPGIDPEILPRVFDAFVTNKETGTGLGLTITYDIIHRHNGRISAENVPGRGALLTFWLPAQGREAA